MANSPIALTLYDEHDEPVKELQRNIVPWGILKKALKLRDLGEKDFDEKSFDELTGFVCEVFGNQVTSKELEEQADTVQIIAVMNAVISRANSYFPNQPAGK